MPEAIGTPDPNAPAASESTSTQEEAAAAAAAAEAAAGDNKPDPWAGLPEQFGWTKTELESTRREAQGLRERLREKDDALKEAKTPEDVAAVHAEYDRKIADLTVAHARETAILKHQVPEEYQEFLTGKTAEELEVQAAKLAARPGAAAVPPVVITQLPLGGGANPGNEPAEDDGRAEYAAWKASR